MTSPGPQRPAPTPRKAVIAGRPDDKRVPPGASGAVVELAAAYLERCLRGYGRSWTTMAFPRGKDGGLSRCLAHAWVPFSLLSYRNVTKTHDS